MALQTSPFFNPGPVAREDGLSIIYLKQKNQIPTILRARDDDDEGYEEGKVVNTQFGSFPHTSLIGLPWGSQVRAFKVDTGSRGRGGKTRAKRKRGHSEENDAEQPDSSGPNKPVETASSGFVHLIPPTPENWTSSLPHRTQVVYTPDYSYILHRLQARPGTSLIEAGGGSGSFTHASARAVFSGYPSAQAAGNLSKKSKLGKVWSYEFHEQRHGKLQKEIQDHGLDGIVQVTHRDVCQDGFLIGTDGDQSPNAEAIFLDLPAPWLALPHLTRHSRSPQTMESSRATSPSLSNNLCFCSALNPRSPIFLCSFSPCIEQVQRTVSTLRQLDWVDISVVEIAHKRFEIRRERVGIEKQRGVLPTAGNVEEAITHLKEVEARLKTFHEPNDDDIEDKAQEPRHHTNNTKQPKVTVIGHKNSPNSKVRLLESLVEGKAYKQGRVTHRPDPELKTHTSYLVFAILPRDWSAEEEEKARAKWPLEDTVASASLMAMSKNEMKKAARLARAEAQVQKDKSEDKASHQQGKNGGDYDDGNDGMEGNPALDTKKGYTRESTDMEPDDITTQETSGGNRNAKSDNRYSPS